MAFDIRRARTFVQDADLSGTPRGILALDADAEAGALLDEAKNQAQVVGSTLFSFAEGVSEKVRQAVSDSALFAQLLANKKTILTNDPLTWFGEYSAALQNIGWLLQDSKWEDYSARGEAGEVHKKIIDVLTVALGGAPTAIAIITAAVNALSAMNEDTPWLRIFEHQSRKGKIARFQVGLVDKGGDTGGASVSMLAFIIKAQTNMTQVLFFKFSNARATLEASTVTASIVKETLEGLGTAIRERTDAYRADYVSRALDLVDAKK